MRAKPPAIRSPIREELAAAAASPSGDQAALDGAFGLASVALDFGYDERFRNSVAEDFKATKEL